MLPLRPEDLVVGNLYKGIWLTVGNEAMNDIWLTNNETTPGGFLTKMDCFVCLDRSQDTWKFKILTSKGEVGWTQFSTGTHWFKEITEENK